MKRKPVTLRTPVNVALLELQRFVDFLHVADPELTPNELMLLAGFLINGLPQVLASSPATLNQLKDIAQAIKKERK